MALKLYYHPLASFCWKTLIALYENDTPFEPRFIDLGKETDRAELTRLWPLCKFPVLRDEARDRTVPEATIIIEYLAQHYPGRTPLVPADPDLARETRLKDRFYDLHVHQHMQRVVADRIRPAGANKDPYGVEEARRALLAAYRMIESDIAGKTWAMGDAYTLADCAASPALYYANKVQPFDSFPNMAAYLRRLTERPAFARVLKEAEPYVHMFPG